MNYYSHIYMKKDCKPCAIIAAWLPFAALSTILSGMVYVAVQQDFRMGANDPQIQIAEDVSNVLKGGVNPTQVVPPNNSDIGSSLSPWLAVYDDSDKAIASSGLLGGASPTPPAGVFDYVRAHGEDRVTWQPSVGVRQALVVTRFSATQGSGFVVAGRSLREVEKGKIC